MGRPRKNEKIELTPEEVMAYASYKSGVPIREITEATGKHFNTIYTWIKKVNTFLEKNGVDINDYRKPMHGMYALWVRSVMINLHKCDPTFTTAHGKGMQYYQDRNINETDGADERTNSELLAELKRIIAPISGAVIAGDEDREGTQTPS